MVEPDDVVDAVAEPAVPSNWLPEPGAEWSIEELETLVRIGVPVVRVEARTRLPVAASRDGGPPFDDRRGSWMDELDHPEHGPVSWLAERHPSGALLSDLESLPTDLTDDDYDAVEVVALWAKLESYCAGEKRRAAAAMARRESLAHGLAHLAAMGIEAGEVSVAADELAPRLGITKPAAGRLVRSGRAMGEIGIPTAEALASGEIDAVKADLILDAIKDLGSDAALDVQERVLPKAPHMSTGMLRREVAAACAAVDPDQFEDRCEHAARLRRVSSPRALPHGMASLYAVLPAVEATQLYRAVDAAARSAKAAGEQRTMDQLRADALAAMGSAAIESGWIGTAPVEMSTSVDPEAAEPERPRLTFGQSPGRGADRHMRVGHIGGASAHVRVVVPFSVLMDDPRGRGHALAPPGLAPPVEAEQGAATTESTSGAERTNRAGCGDVTGCRNGAERRGGALLANGAERRGGAGLANGAEWSDGAACTNGADESGEPDRADIPGAQRLAGVPARQLPIADQLTIPMLDGYGPIPAAVARALAAGSTWSRLVLDPIDRTILELSADTYRPPAGMARLVRAAQPYCASPACNVASDSCDLNHRIPHPVGATSVWNVDPECRRDHLLLTHAGWSCQQDPEPGGSRTWTTGTGHVYVQQLDGAVSLAPKPAVRPIPSDDDPLPF